VADEPGEQEARSSEWSVDSIPMLEIAGTAPDGGIVFESAAGATRLSNGTIVIGDGMARTIRFFDASGQAAFTVGRKGEGPGEFDHIEWLGQCETDTVFVWDPDLHRVTVIDAGGNVVRSHRMPADPSAPPPSIVNCSRNGVFAFIGTPEGLRGAFDRYSAPLMLADTRGNVTRRLGDVPAFEGSPLGKITSFAVGADHLYMGTKDSAFIDVFSQAGDRLGGLAVGVALRPPTQEHFERAIDAQVARLGSVSDREFLKEILLRRPMPEHMPPYAGLFTNSSGVLWVQTSLAGDPDTRLRALHPDGGVLAQLLIPRYMTVFEVGQDYVLGRYVDAGGEPYVIMYRIRTS
jgi:hypothetical protein